MSDDGVVFRASFVGADAVASGISRIRQSIESFNSDQASAPSTAPSYAPGQRVGCRFGIDIGVQPQNGATGRIAQRQLDVLVYKVVHELGVIAATGSRNAPSRDYQVVVSLPAIARSAKIGDARSTMDNSALKLNLRGSQDSERRQNEEYHGDGTCGPRQQAAHLNGLPASLRLCEFTRTIGDFRLFVKIGLG